MTNGSGTSGLRQPARRAGGLLAATAMVAGLAAGAPRPADDWTTMPLPALTLHTGRAVFYATSTITDFQGVTTVLRGRTEAAPSLRAARGSFEFDVATLATGNTTRDRHMREALEADSLPVLRFRVDSVSVRAVRADTAETVLQGALTVHGVTRAVPIPARIEHRGDTLRVQAYTTLRLGDYGIRKNLSRALGAVKVGQEVTISVEARFTVP
jgi:polyisoprenoid-binding protein YceI